MFGGVTTLSVPPSGTAAARLQRRAQAVARLRHPNLVRMLPLPGGAGLSPVLGNAHRLSDFTLPRGTFKRFDLAQVVRLLVDVLSGLSALHEVVTDGAAFEHGLISPQNIYIDEHGTARLVPLLPAHFSANAKVERTGYAAPERLLGGPTDARSDVFSVGVMLWEALSGKRLCPDGTVDALLANGKRPPPLQLAARLRWAQPLCVIAERAIAFEPAERFASALELSSAISQAAAPQLARVDDDAWQEEAPTPVFQPRLHLAQLRASTPPPAVLTVVTAPASAPPASEPPASSPRSLEPSSVEASESSPLPRPRRSRLGGAVLALAVLAVVVGAARYAPLPRGFPTSKRVAPWASPPVAAAAAPAPLPHASPVPLPVTPAAAASVASPPLASVSASASASGAPAAVTPSLAKPRSAPRPVAPKPRARSEDYGI